MSTNFKKHTKAKQLITTKSPYNLARELVNAEEEVDRLKRLIVKSFPTNPKAKEFFRG